MTDYKPTIGLEIHAELHTKTKMFCGCKNDPDEARPNSNVCPICMGHPGTLPVINKEALKKVLQVGLAANGSSPRLSEFDRKNYFYPDIPKGYQISQYKYPLVSGGVIAEVELTRIHLEEDTARSSHTPQGVSLVDFNRAGVPLMELVTEPVLHSPQEISKFARELQLLLQYLGVSEANMEKGQMRVEANVSVSNSESLGTKVEIKNLNSFKVAEKAVEYEINRQVGLLKEGGVINQETRGWDEKKEITFSQRSKESSHDYRYFPDPDLPKLDIDKIEELAAEVIGANMSETPQGKRARYLKDYGIKEQDIEFYIHNKVYAVFFEDVVSYLSKDTYQLASNYIVSDIAGAGSIGSIEPRNLAKLIEMISQDIVSSRGAKNIIADMLLTGDEPEKIAKKMNLLQISDESEIRGIVEKVIIDNPTIDNQQFLVGQVMAVSGGRANPKIVNKIIRDIKK